jgi:hypothetical protein
MAVGQKNNISSVEGYNFSIAHYFTLEENWQIIIDKFSFNLIMLFIRVDFSDPEYRFN